MACVWLVLLGDQCTCKDGVKAAGLQCKLLFDKILNMNFALHDRFCISSEVLSQEVNGETVLLDLEGECYFGLNEVGTRIWLLQRCESSVGEVLDGLSDEYDVSREQLESDVGDLLDKLTNAGLVTLAS